MNQIVLKVRTYNYKRAEVIGSQEHYTRYKVWAEAIASDEPYHIAAARWLQRFSQVQKGEEK